MGELSDRFAELMARMAKSDADLFRTIGEQNASVRQMVDELVAIPEPGAKIDATTATLAPAGLLPAEQCDQKALKARFGKVADAQAWVESQIGKAPKKPTWLVIEQTCRSGAWPLVAARTTAATKGISSEQLDERLTVLETKLTQRFDRLEALLLVIAGGNPSSSPHQIDQG